MQDVLSNGDATSDVRIEGAGQDPSATMSVIEHLDELRARLIVCLAAVVVASLAVFSFQEPLFRILQVPLQGWKTSHVDPALIITAPGEYFIAMVKVAFLGGVTLALPVLLYQLLAFIGPGLLPNEKRWVVPVVCGACVAFGAGALFGFYLLLPVGLQFLLGIAPDNVRPMLSVAKYISFAAGSIFATGLCFELPIFLLAASRLGVVTSYSLIRYRKNILVASFVLAAIITPSIDIVTQCLLAGALYALFELSVILIRATGR